MPAIPLPAILVGTHRTWKGSIAYSQSEPTYQEAGKNIWWQEYFFETSGRRSKGKKSWKTR
jgi:hypothetical protein